MPKREAYELRLTENKRGHSLQGAHGTISEYEGDVT